MSEVRSVGSPGWGQGHREAFPLSLLVPGGSAGTVSPQCHGQAVSVWLLPRDVIARERDGATTPFAGSIAGECRWREMSCRVEEFQLISHALLI